MKSILFLLCLSCLNICFSQSDNSNTNEFFETVGEGKVYNIVPEKPSFADGQKALLDYLKDSLVYPIDAKQNRIEGIVKVNFIIMSNGEIRNPKVISGLGMGCDEEALRLVKNMPKWKPGKSKGKEVNTNFILPVKFEISDKASFSIKEPALTAANSQAQEDTTIRIFANHMAEFPAGNKAMYIFIANNLNYPKNLFDIAGMVVVKFIVEKDGSITRPQIAKGIRKDFDEEAIRLVKSMPKFKPANLNGINVRSYFTVPIRFELQKE
jgi:TonB family protein